MLHSPQLFSSIQPESRCLTDVDWPLMGRVEPLDVLLVAHCPPACCNIVAVLVPISDLFELYPWESGVALLAVGVGLFELHPAAFDSVSNVRFHIVVEVLELVNEVLRLVFVAFVSQGTLVGTMFLIKRC